MPFHHPIIVHAPKLSPDIVKMWQGSGYTNVYFAIAPDSFDFLMGRDIPENRFILESSKASSTSLLVPKAIVSIIKQQGNGVQNF